MDITIREYQPEDTVELLTICNQIIEEEDSFPWDKPFDQDSGIAMLTYHAV